MNLLALVPLLFLGACSLAPKYERPLSPIPDHISETAANADDLKALDDWKSYFTDPALAKVIEAALAHNRDLKVAVLRMQEFRDLYQIQFSERVPNVAGNASFARGKQIDPVSGQGVTASQYQASVGLTVYELDFFGRVKSLSDAALERYLATESAVRAARMTLVAQTASAYLRELSLAQQEQLSIDTLKSREDTRKIDESRLKSGVSNQLEMKTSEMLVESSRASLAEVRREREQNRNALRVLVGDFAFSPEASELHVGEIKFKELKPGMSSDLLTRRPDIMQSESLLKAANANIGAARAAFFPSISLTSNFGSLSPDFDGLFKAGTETWNFIPQINIPILTGGRNRANLDVAHVRKDIAVAQYEQVVQNAFREVKDSLVAHDLIMQQVAAQKAVRDADIERSRLAQKRYERGVSGYLEYLDSERSQFESDRAYLRLNELRLVNDIALYRALGGGWQ